MTSELVARFEDCTLPPADFPSETLFSDVARRTFVLPDRGVLP